MQIPFFKLNFYFSYPNIDTFYKPTLSFVKNKIDIFFFILANNYTIE